MTCIIDDESTVLQHVHAKNTTSIDTDIHFGAGKEKAGDLT